MADRECYIAMLEMDNHLHALSIKERQVIVEPTEDLEEISLDDNVPGRITHIGMQADPLVRQELAFFLKNNHDVFAWSHENMPGISPSNGPQVQRMPILPSSLTKEENFCTGKKQGHSRGGAQTTRGRFH